MNIGKSINVGSKATGSAMRRATDIAMGGNRQTKIANSLPMPKGMRKSIHPGSAAGLKNHKTVHLNTEGAGYLNPVNQTARYTKRIHTNPKVDVVTSVGFSPRNRTLDTRPLGSNCGTVKLLRERL